MSWQLDQNALGHLDEAGGPYESSAYRDACVDAVAGLRDVSVAARLADGTTAAIALLRRGRTASSVPYGYGGVRATRPLTDPERLGFLELARRHARAWALVVTSTGEENALGGQIALARVVDVRTRPSSALQKQTRYYAGRPAKLGCELERSDDPEPLIRVYRTASASWTVRYPERLVRTAAARGLPRFYYVRDAAGEIVSVLAALPARHEWMYWFGAQLDAGREVGGSYLTVATLLEDAHEAGAERVNLGASDGLPGVHAFKARWGGTEVPVTSLRIGRTRAAALVGLAGRLREKLG